MRRLRLKVLQYLPACNKFAGWILGASSMMIIRNQTKLSPVILEQMVGSNQMAADAY